MSESTFSGSCLCGSVAYEIKGVPWRFYHCHCERCRKASGTGHASNILIRNPSSVTWTAGENLLSYYKVPEAKRFATSFCNNCGSLMPRVAPDMSFVAIPAGTLDHEPDILPEARIFQDSRAGWSCNDAEIPGFDHYPPYAD